MSLADWHKQILNSLAHFQKPAAGLSQPPAGGGRDRMELLCDVRRLLGPDDHAIDVWGPAIQRWSANVGEHHRRFVLEQLGSLVQAIDAEIARSLGGSNDEFVLASDFPGVQFCGGPVPLVYGLLSGLPAGHRLQTLTKEPYIFNGQRALILGYALPSPPWRPRRFYPTELVRRLTTDRRQEQAAGEATETRRQRNQAEQEKQRREQSPEGQIASLQRRLAALECS